MRQRCGQRQIAACLGACMLVIGALLLAPEGQARLRYYSLVEKVRGVDLIVFGKVVELCASTIRVTHGKTLKGTPRASQIEVVWDQTSNMEQRPAEYQIGEELLLFVNSKDDLYEPLGGAQGTVVLQPGEAGIYQVLVRKILSFDAQDDPDAKKDILLDLLGMESRLGQRSALLIIFLEYHTKAFPTAPLVQPVRKLAQTSERRVAGLATQVLGSIGDKSIVPFLIESLGSADWSVAQTASRILKFRTGMDLKFDGKAPQEARIRASQKWKTWWEENKEKVKWRK